MSHRLARPLTAGVLAALAAGLVGAPAHAAPAPAAGYLVSTADGQAAPLAADLRRAGVAVTRELDGVGVLAVLATGQDVARLRADPRVDAVSADGRSALQADTWSSTGNAGSLYNVTAGTGARAAWPAATGRGVDVALIDSGVSPVAGLDAPGKVLQGPDLSFDSQLPGLRHLDGFGHGTHLAGIIAGRDAAFAGPSDTTSFAGVAPDARVVSVKVADAYGNADVSQVIAGIDWVVQHRRDPGMNIRVLNLSVGLPSTNSAQVDPLAHAAEQAWLKGIVVVASAGNDGGDDGHLLSPAYDPYVIAVGASDSRGTVDPADDGVPDFSSRGSAQRSPDLVAPGRSIASLRVPGSYLDQQYGGSATIGSRYFRGSGTSQSTAVVSGAAALLLQRRPGLTPDQVKDVLRAGAAKLASAPVSAQGRGSLRVGPSMAAAPGLLGQLLPRSTGTGSLDRARGGYRVESGGVALTGERDVFGAAFSSPLHAARALSGTAWAGGTWNGSTLTGTAFGPDGGWASATWSGVDWAGRSWSSRGGSAATWDGRGWAGGYWSGRSWAGRSWAGRSWATVDWR